MNIFFLLLNPSETFFGLIPTPLIVAICVAIFGVIGFYARRFYQSRDSAELNAFNQLERLFGVLSTQLEKKDLSDKEKEKEILRLQILSDILIEKMKSGRLDLLDLRYALRHIRRVLDENDICDEKIIELVTDLDTKLKDISEQLRHEALVKQ